MLAHPIGHLGALIRQVHFHGEDEGAALVLTIRVHRDFSSAVLNDALADHETDADALLVEAAGPLHFAKHAKELILLSFIYPDARVDHVHYQLFTLQVVGGPNLDLAAQRELERILGQVDQDLLQADLVPYQLVRQTDLVLHGV